MSAPDKKGPGARRMVRVKVRIPESWHRQTIDAMGWARSAASIFAITRSLEPGRKKEWVITHRATGRKINQLFFADRASALSAADKFERIKGFAAARHATDPWGPSASMDEAVREQGWRIVKRLSEASK